MGFCAYGILGAPHHGDGDDYRNDDDDQQGATGGADRSLVQARVKSRLLRCKHLLLHGHWTI